ncbi:hypothetical protein, partial [Escherichia coli]|uniref:hypothetical protein n=1 Tax=Escherichia coli TaxID=562 RepID=UPI001A7E150B
GLRSGKPRPTGRGAVTSRHRGATFFHVTENHEKTESNIHYYMVIVNIINVIINPHIMHNNM